MSDERIKKILARHETLKERRRAWEENYWYDISDYILNERGWFAERDKGQEGRRRQNKVLNGVATRAVRILAAGLQGGLTSPSRKWFRLKLPIYNMLNISPVRRYLEAAEEGMYTVFAGSNFYSCMHQFFTEQPTFGTSVMLIEFDEAKVVRCRILTCGEYYLGANALGEVDTLHVPESLTAEQMIDEFGLDMVGDNVKRAAEGNSAERFEVLHIIQRRRKRDHTLEDNLNMPWESLWIDLSGNEKKFLRESGYRSQPFVAGRWSVVGTEIYGRGPGQDALPDVLGLQSMERTSLKQVHKSADPPVRKPVDMDGPLNMLPGGISVYNPANPNALGPLYQVTPNTRELDAKIQRQELAIRETFFNDIFLMSLGQQYGQPPTAEEVGERREEKLLMMGPTIERQLSETLDPLIDRVFDCMDQAMVLPEPPTQLQGVPLEVEFISHLAQAQKVAETRSVRAVTAFIGELSGLATEVLDLLDADQAVRRVREYSGAPDDLLREEEAVAQIREQRAAKQAQMEQMARAQMAAQQLPALAGAARDLNAAGQGQVVSEALNTLEQQQNAY